MADRYAGARVRAAHRQHVAQWTNHPDTHGTPTLDIPTTEIGNHVRGQPADTNPNITHYNTELADLEDDYYGDVYG